jgi:ABC-type microcin C transport system permease subunit YejB
VIGNFATMHLLTKTASSTRSTSNTRGHRQGQGLRPTTALYGHVFRNATLLVIAGFPRRHRDFHWLAAGRSEIFPDGPGPDEL